MLPDRQSKQSSPYSSHITFKGGGGVVATEREDGFSGPNTMPDTDG